MDTCFCEKSFIDRSLLVLKILKGGIPPIATQAKKANGE